MVIISTTTMLRANIVYIEKTSFKPVPLICMMFILFLSISHQRGYKNEVAAGQP